ncbi:MAG: efflux RND transporter periplasmic adaptor subunit, partial [Myxococcales bacterium]|nr:efflux RND transporter periplasmic adaptor subunit [Myxococcales bacterium]
MIGLSLAGGCGGDEGTITTTVAVDKGNLVFASSFYGEIQSAKSIPVHAPETRGSDSFTIQTVLPDGTEVKEGDVVLTFDSGPMTDTLRTREMDLAVAKANEERERFALEREKLELDLGLKRQELLLEKAKLAVVEGVNFISKVQLEKAKADVARAELELGLARDAVKGFERKRKATLEVQRIKVADAAAKVEETRQQLLDLDVKAPANGVIYAPYTRMNWRRSKAAPGVVARSGDKILEIPDLENLEAHIFVRQRDASLLREGDQATVFAAVLPNQPIKGKVVRKEAFAR